MSLTGIVSGLWEAGVYQAPPRPLAIVGSHPDTRENAPFDDPDYEIWLYNEAPMKPEVYPRWDGSLQIHKDNVYSSETNWVNKDYWEWLQQDHGPDKRIFMQYVDHRVPNSVKYPLNEILDRFQRRYLRSSPAMALALALYLGYTDIALYGNELSSNAEYHYQAANFTYWIGVADGMPDVTLDLQCWQSEFNQSIYGYEGELQLDVSHFLRLLKDHKTIYRGKVKAVEKLKNKLDAAITDNNFDKSGELSLAVETATINTGEVFGAMSEAERYAERTDHISRQEFERVSAQAQLDGEEHEKNMNFAGGKCEYVWNAWVQSGALQAKNQFRTFLKEKNEHAMEMGKALGVFRENLAYQQEYDEKVQMAGGLRAVTFEGRATVLAQPLGGKS